MQLSQAGADPLDSLIASREQFLAFIRRKVSDPELAEDILQDSFLKALRAAPALRDHDRLVAWFYRVLRNAVVDAYRKKGATPPPADVSVLEDLPEEETDHAVVCECFRTLLPALKPEYAQLIEDIDLRNEPASAEAERLGISANNLKVRHHRARAALRRSLEATCRTCAEHHCLDCTCKSA